MCIRDRDKKYELIKKIKGKEVYGGVGIMARKKDVSIDLGTNSCEIEVHPYPLKQNIYGILAKNNKMLHMGYKKETSSYKNTDQEYSKEMEFAKTSKVTLSLDNSQADSGNVYGIRAERGKIRIDKDVEIIKAATKNSGYGTFDAISTVGKNSEIYLTAKFKMLGTAITGNVDKTKNARTAVTLAGYNLSLIHI